MIAVDWGTTNLRAFRLDPSGAILDRRSSPQGILQVPAGGFPNVLRDTVADWLAAGESRILLCGMVGSRHGWAEAPYVPCPAAPAALVAALTSVPFDGAEVRILPGVSGLDPTGHPEVMRGEETEIVGITEARPEEDRLLCLPGTHSKWVVWQNGHIACFTTSLTGDLYAALGKETLLARTLAAVPQTHDDRAFLCGVTRSAEPGGLLHHLFGVRTLTLTGTLPAAAAAPYLSGLLIGHEVRANLPPAALVHLAGAVPLRALYAQAIAACGGAVTFEGEDAALRGLIAFARRIQWI